MARSWQYARWRRVVVQVILWVILGGTLAVAQLVVRHRRLVGTVELAADRTADLPGGVVVGVRLPKGWQVELDAGEHPGDGDAEREFQAVEPAGGVGGVPEPGDGDFGRGLMVRFQPLPAMRTAKQQLGRSGVLSDTAELSVPGGGSITVAGTDGIWVALGRPVRVPPGRGPAARPAYAAVGVVSAGPASPVPVAVTVLLECPYGDSDVKGDLDLLRRVAAAVTVQRDRAPAVPTIHPPAGVP